MNIRPYAERLARSLPERFTFKKHVGNCWSIGGPGVDKPMTQFSDSRKWWAFFGPLADEFGVTSGDIYFASIDLKDLLEALAEATCVAVEDRPPSSGVQSGVQGPSEPGQNEGEAA
jgi:hypothetical protein